MKILVFNWQDIRNPLAGGAEVHFHEIFSRVVRLGHEVTLFCSRFDGAPAEEVIDGIRVVREGGRYLFNFRVPLRYWTRFRHEGYDVVIDDMNKIPFFTPLFVRERLFVLIHHLFGESIFRETSFPFALYVNLTERAGVALCRFRRVPMMVVSPSTRSELIGKGFRQEDIHIVPNCVDHERYHPTGIARSTTPLVGYFGRLKRYKSVDHLFTAFTLLRDQFPNLQLLIIGDGDDRARLEALARQMGLHHSVRFTGFVDEAEKVRLLQHVWFMVNTSSKEGWGLTVIESNACETTVIAADVPGLRDAVKDGETGLLYRYGDIDDLAGKMQLLLTDEHLRDRLSHGARSWAQTFDWATVARDTVTLLASRSHSTTASVNAAAGL